MRTLPQDDELLAALLAQHRPRGPGCRARIANAIGWVLAVGMFVTVMAKVLPGVLVDYGVTTPEQLVKVLHMDVATPGASTIGDMTNRNRIDGVPASQQQPIEQPAAPLPDCATVQDTTTACALGVNSPIGGNSTAVETPTATPTDAPDLQATANQDATIAAWLVATPEWSPTPWPTATPMPTEYVPTFKAEFTPAPECSPFVGYVGPDKARCAAVFATQTAEAGE